MKRRKSEEQFAFGLDQGPIKAPILFVIHRITVEQRGPYCWTLSEGAAGRITALLNDDAGRRRGKYRALRIDGREMVTGEDLP